MRILIVDDDKAIRDALSDLITDLGHHAQTCASTEEAIILLENAVYQLVLSDIRMPGKSGIQLLNIIKQRPDAKLIDVVLLTGFASKESVLEALRAGAYDYLEKPVNVGNLANVIRNVAERHALITENIVYSAKIKKRADEIAQDFQSEISVLKEELALTELRTLGIHGEKMRSIRELALKYHEDRDIPVLIQGETGTGKEVVARLIHYGAHNRSCGPFLDINCATITPTLFEAELFGYEPGAYTGASQKGGKGKLEAASGGTLFLDEVSEMSLEIQVKLLRVLQEKEFYRLGGNKKIKADIRIICATNKDLYTLVEDGQFRQDLFYRLNMGTIFIPPLRERQDELLFLAQLFLDMFAAKKNKQFKVFSPQAQQLLCRHSWPGNVRELKNAIEWSVFMHDGPELKAEHLNIIAGGKAKRKFVLGQDDYLLPGEAFLLKDFINEVILKAVALHDGNKQLAAKYLGVSRTAIYNQLEKSSVKGGE